MGASWRNALKSEFSKAYFEEVFTLSFFFCFCFVFCLFWGGGRFKLYWSLKNRNVQSVILILSEDSKIKAVNKWKVLSEHCMQLGLLMLFCHNTWKNTGWGQGKILFLDF